MGGDAINFGRESLFTRGATLIRSKVQFPPGHDRYCDHTVGLEGLVLYRVTPLDFWSARCKSSIVPPKGGVLCTKSDPGIISLISYVITP